MHFKYNKKILALIVAAMFIGFFGCKGEKMKMSKVTYKSIKDVPAATWEKLAKKKIYFAHQSVGFNIMEGIQDVVDENPEIKLHIVETADESDFKAGLIAHSRIGKNLHPDTKINEFVTFINRGIGKKADAAALKFCYVDINAKTDVNKLFSDYDHAIAQLKKKYPDMIIIHFTDPLTVTKTTWKTWLKKLFRKKNIWEYDDNIKRNEYNELLRKKYEGREPILDIAEIESTYPDGTRCTFEKEGKTYYAMVPEYSIDGGHLNNLGRKKVAEQFLILLARLSS